MQKRLIILPVCIIFIYSSDAQTNKRALCFCSAPKSKHALFANKNTKIDGADTLPAFANTPASEGNVYIAERCVIFKQFLFKNLIDTRKAEKNEKIRELF